MGSPDMSIVSFFQLGRCLQMLTPALTILQLDFFDALYLRMLLKTIQKIQLIQNAATQVIILSQLFWYDMSLCMSRIDCQLEFKALIITIKLSVAWSLIIQESTSLQLFLPVQSSQAEWAYAQVPSIKSFHRVRVRKHIFSDKTPTVWNNILQSYSTLTLQMSQKSLKTWLYYQTWS